MILNYFELIKDQIVEEFKSIKANELILVLNYLKTIPLLLVINILDC